MASVKDHVLLCLQAFDVLSAAVSAIEAVVAGQPDTSDDSRPRGFSLATINDQTARFKIWAGNIGAHRKGRSSLDHRLREASHIRAQVIRLLGDLQEALQDGEIFSIETWRLHCLTDRSHFHITRRPRTMGQGARIAGRTL